jgi:hypothetical protein
MAKTISLILLAAIVLPRATQAEEVDSTESAKNSAREGDCGEKFSKIAKYDRRKGTDKYPSWAGYRRVRILPTGAHKWTDDDYKSLSQVKVTDLFPLTTGRDTRLTISPESLKGFDNFLQDYREALYNRLEALDKANGGHQIGKNRLREFHKWLWQQSKENNLPLAEYNLEITPLVKALQDEGHDMTLEQLADYIFLHKFLPAELNVEPSNVFEYLKDEPPGMQALIAERATNVISEMGQHFKNGINEFLGVGLFAIGFGAVLDNLARHPIQSAVESTLDKTKEELSLYVNQSRSKRAQSTEALNEIHEAMFKWANNNNSDDFKYSDSVIQKMLPTLFARLKKSNKKGKAVDFELDLGKKILAEEQELLPLIGSIDSSTETKENADLNPVRQARLASDLADWMIANYLYDNGNPKHPSSKESEYSDATKLIFQKAYDLFTNPHSSNKLPTLVSELNFRLGKLSVLLEDSEVVDKENVEAALEKLKESTPP